MFAYKRSHIIQNKITHSSYLYLLFILQDLTFYQASDMQHENKNENLKGY